MGNIVFKDFSAFYKLKRKKYLVAIDNISLQIKGGEFVAVCGPSGCGKSTLLKSVMGMIEYTEGQLLIDGVSADYQSVKKQRFSYVAQGANLYPHLTVFENIAFPLRNKKISQIEIVDAVTSVAEQTGIKLLLTRKPFQLSIGQQQRVQLARALVKRADILLLDEPFSNQDLRSSEDLKELVKSIYQTLGCTVIMATHNLSDVKTLAEKVLILKEGAVSAFGKTDTVISGANDV